MKTTMPTYRPTAQRSSEEPKPVRNYGLILIGTSGWTDIVKRAAESNKGGEQ